MAQYLPIPVIFVPGESFFHRLHPLAKLVWAVGAVVTAFATRNPLVLICMFALALTFITLARVLPAGPIRFLDLGCGDARVIARLAAARPGS